jgi:hypothetical protein
MRTNQVMKTQIEIIPIAKKKADQRGLTEDQLLDVLKAPDQIVKGYGGRKVAQKKYKMGEGEFLLRVVYEEGQNTLKVITAYLTSKVRRYWRGDNEN